MACPLEAMKIHIAEASNAVLNHFTALSLDADPVMAYTDNPELAAGIAARLNGHGLTMCEDVETGFTSVTIVSPCHCFIERNPRVALLRCYLAAVYGDFLELPEHLVADQLNYRNLWSSSPRCGE